MNTTQDLGSTRPTCAEVRKQRMLRELRHTMPEGFGPWLNVKLLGGFAIGLALALSPVGLRTAAEPAATAADTQAVVASLFVAGSDIVAGN